jgi:hypothetical protein
MRLSKSLIGPAAALLALPVICATGSSAQPADYVLTVTSDFSVSGQVSTVGVIPPWNADLNVAPVHSDADARSYGGLVYIVNHLYGDNIQVLDPQQGFATIRQFSVGPGTNPVDIAFVSAEQAYVSRNDSALLLEVDTTTGAVTDSIDLSPYADGDGLPEMAGLAVRGGHLFVALQRLDRDYYWTPVPPSYLVVVDTATNEIVDPDPEVPGLPAITLAATNPYRELHLDGDTLYLAESGAWGAMDGGIEAIDTGSMTPQGLIATEAQLGGDLYDFTLPQDGRAYAVVTSSAGGWEQFAISFDWSTGEKIADVWRPGGYDVMDIETHPGTGQLFLADRTYTDPGVRVFDTAGDVQLTTSPLTVGLPPYDLVVIGDDVTGVSSDPAVRPPGLVATPNPSRSGDVVEIVVLDGPMASDTSSRSLAGRSEGGVTVSVYDPSGRLVRTLGPSVEGLALRWDGRNGAGEKVASGVYFVRADLAGGAVASTKVVIR